MSRDSKQNKMEKFKRPLNNLKNLNTKKQETQLKK